MSCSVNAAQSQEGTELVTYIYYTHKRIKELVSFMAAACSRYGDRHQQVSDYTQLYNIDCGPLTVKPFV